jgi:hypothetical protein
LVADLVERFERARKVFLSPDYKEEQLRAVCLTIWRSTFGARTFHAELLGKVIRLTAGHQAKVEEEPEVRKAGGVYYTPTKSVRSGCVHLTDAKSCRTIQTNDRAWHDHAL